MNGIQSYYHADNDGGDEDSRQPAVNVAAIAARYAARNTDIRTQADIALLLGEIRRLRRRLWVANIRIANLVAAGRATLTAALDGEADPLAYLRDELPPAPPGHPLHGTGRGWCR